MKRIILFIVAALVVNFTTAATDTLTDSSVQIERKIEDINKNYAPVISFTSRVDTTFVLPPPTTEDSVKIIKVVNGVVNILTVFTGDMPLIDQFLKSEYFSGGLVAIIFSIWRFVAIRRLKRKGVIPKDYKVRI